MHPFPNLISLPPMGPHHSPHLTVPGGAQCDKSWLWSQAQEEENRGMVQMLLLTSPPPSLEAWASSYLLHLLLG